MLSTITLLSSLQVGHLLGDLLELLARAPQALRQIGADERTVAQATPVTKTE